MFEIEIDGKKYTANKGESIIAVADRNNISIPRFCYHPQLSIAANCRMCLVEVAKSPKTLPACATPVAPNMQVFTKSKATLESQHSVMEFLLINHPLDCPICDQGGECELQDLSIGYGIDHSRFHEPKRVVEDPNLGPLIATDLTRCIHCTRCVRFGDEIAGVRELGLIGRGEHAKITNYLENSVDNTVSGNIIDLCPVGALTAKPSRYHGRSWEYKEHASISPHDCIGTNLFIHTFKNAIIRIVPKENKYINSIWISDRDRFSYEGLSADRLSMPQIKYNNVWHDLDWAGALREINARIKGTIATHGAEAVGAIASYSQTVEEYYLIQKFLRSYGVQNIDHRLREQDLANNYLPDYVDLIDTVELDNLAAKYKKILLVGSDILEEQPILAICLKKFMHHGGKILAINTHDYKYNFDVSSNIIVGENLDLCLLQIIKTLLKPSSYALQNVMQHIEVNDAIAEFATNLALDIMQGECLILLGSYAYMHFNYNAILEFAKTLKNILKAELSILTYGSNAFGAWRTGCVPHLKPHGVYNNNAGQSIHAMLDVEKVPAIKLFLLFNIELELDYIKGAQALKALSHADYVIAFSSYDSEKLREFADLVIPIAPFSENEGTYVNCWGVEQSFAHAVMSHGQARPLWKILRMLGAEAKFANFNYLYLSEVLAEFKQAQGEVKKSYEPIGIDLDLIVKVLDYYKNKPANNKFDTNYIRLAPVPLYAVDATVRRATALQKTKSMQNINYIEVHPVLANKLDIKEHDVIVAKTNFATVRLPVRYNTRLMPHMVIIPQGIAMTENLGMPYESLSLAKE